MHLTSGRHSRISTLAVRPPAGRAGQEACSQLTMRRRLHQAETAESLSSLSDEKFTDRLGGQWMVDTYW